MGLLCIRGVRVHLGDIMWSKTYIYIVPSTADGDVDGIWFSLFGASVQFGRNDNKRVLFC